MNKNLPTIAASMVDVRLQIAQSRGIDTEAVLQRVGLNAEDLKQPDARITIAQDWAVWQELVNIAQDPTLGLKLGCTPMLSGLGPMSYVILNAETIADAMQMFARYQRLLADVGRVTVVETPESVDYVVTCEDWDWCEAERYIVDHWMAITKTVTMALAGNQTHPFLLAVHFQYDYPPDLPDLSLYRESFGDVVFKFGCPDTRCIFSRETLTIPVVGANPELKALFEHQAQTIIARYTEDQLSDRVRQRIALAIQGELPTMQEIATQLTLSPRSLQRKLQAEDTSFQTLLDEVRRDLAIEFLREQNLNKTEIAYLLVFSDLSTFSRRFKTWTGYSPSGFQKCRQGDIAPQG
ncbi:MAG: AraC family transcriptional regulator [Spirulina sp. SIO3F2]|nr:AraC family transcriptional regulator [Spirulina sp. SIO3F2]